MSSLTVEHRIRAVRWKLGLPVAAGDVEAARADWDEIARDPKPLQVLADEVARQLCRPLLAALSTALTGQSRSGFEWGESLAGRFADWVCEEEQVRSAKVSGLIRGALQGPTQPVKPTGLHPSVLNALPPVVPVPVPPPAAAPPPAAWGYRPVPDSPRPYPESLALDLANPPKGFRAFGARVRGKKHKHDGSNCDDCFAFEQTGDWTLVAVADGAGSKKLSRVGAKAATEAAVRHLGEEVRLRPADPRATLAGWSAALAADGQGALHAPDLEAIRQALIAAMRAALDAVRDAAAECAADAAVTADLGRPAEVNDLACTLLLAVVRRVQLDGEQRQLVMACQVGDGTVGALHRNGSAVILGAADSGGHAGETEFLTSAGKADPAFLNGKTAAALIDLHALLVTTDGVADDYFPAQEHLARLWGDLVVNGVPDLAAPPAEAVITSDVLDRAGSLEYGTPAEVIGPEPRQRVTLRAVEELAQRLGHVTLDELMKHPSVVWAGRRPLPGGSASERLRLWLDAYHVRASFDDRTLVCVHRENLA